MSSCEPETPDPDLTRDSDPETYQEALDKALHFLAFRARSVSEVRTRLQRDDYPPTIIEEVILRLLELRYLDDGAFALTLARDYLNAARPRGEFAIFTRLRGFGVAEETARAAIDEALQDADETPADRVRRAAERWCRRLRPGSDRTRDRRRLYNHLARAGFPRELVRSTTDELLPPDQGPFHND